MPTSDDGIRIHPATGHLGRRALLRSLFLAGGGLARGKNPDAVFALLTHDHGDHIGD